MLSHHACDGLEFIGIGAARRMARVVGARRVLTANLEKLAKPIGGFHLHAVARRQRYTTIFAFWCIFRWL